MNELINIKNENGKKAVSARELYLGLGLNKTQWSRWHPLNITENEYFKENTDWAGVRHDVEGNETMDFAISIDYAKHIAMMARTEKSHLYRNYFMECEKQVQAVKQMSQAELTAAIAQNQVEIERTANAALAMATKASQQITYALDVFAETPAAENWKQEMNNKINQLILDNRLNYQQFKHETYTELENKAGCDLAARQNNLKKRLKANGATYETRLAATKLDVIDRDKLLRPIYEGIVRKHQVKFANRGLADAVMSR